MVIREQQKFTLTLNGSTISQARLLWFVLSLLIGSPGRITNQYQNREKKFHWNNGEMIRYFSALYTLTIREPCTHQATGFFLACLSFMPSRDSIWHIQLTTLVHILHLRLRKNASNPPEYRSPLSMTEALPVLIITPFTGRKNLASYADLYSLFSMEKWKKKTQKSAHSTLLAEFSK